MNKKFFTGVSVIPVIASVIFILLLASCGGGGSNSGTDNGPGGTVLSASIPSSEINVTVSDGPEDYLLSWDVNRESAVNRAGGGYKIYYSANSGFNIGDDGVKIINVPYVSGEYAPTSYTINLANGTWYFLITAYSVF